MAIDYDLTLAGDIPLLDLAECAIPDASERATPVDASATRLSADHAQHHGYVLDFMSGHNGYCDAESDDGSHWEWEPASYVMISFAMVKDELVSKGIPNMLTVVARILACRPEDDLALVENGNWLLLTRVNGVLRKHNRGKWWDHYGFANDIIPG